MDGHGLEFMVESLENRQMLAGDVSVELTNRFDLKIDGDDASNNITVEVADGVLSVYAHDGTSVNGRLNGTVEFEVEGGLRDLKIRLRDGDDRLTIDSGEFRNGRLDMGDDNDDILILSTQFTGNVRASLGDGYVAEDTRLGEQTFIAQFGSIDGRLTVRGDDTEDVVGLIGLTILGGTRVSLGDGDDLVQVGLSELGGRSSFRLGDGSDGMSLSSTSTPGSFRASGGSGDDLFLVASPDDDFDPSLSGFEVSTYDEN